MLDEQHQTDGQFGRSELPSSPTVPPSWCLAPQILFRETQRTEKTALAIATDRRQKRLRRVCMCALRAQHVSRQRGFASLAWVQSHDPSSCLAFDRLSCRFQTKGKKKKICSVLECYLVHQSLATSLVHRKEHFVSISALLIFIFILCLFYFHLL
jgi:hypothetical protein